MTLVERAEHDHAKVLARVLSRRSKCTRLKIEERIHRHSNGLIYTE
jgi:hypothetical protein